MLQEGPNEVGPSEVVPLPEEMMKSLPVVMLSPGGDVSSPPEVKKKRDRRRLRHERWLKSKIEQLLQCIDHSLVTKSTYLHDPLMTNIHCVYIHSSRLLSGLPI